MADLPDISVVVPFYDEADSVDPVLDELFGVLERIGRPFEVVAVDDGSRDETPAHLRAQRTRRPALRVVRFERNAGQSAAFSAGFRIARGGVIVTMDGDGQNDPADIPRLLERLKEADAVFGVRARRRDSWLRRISSRIGNAVRRAATGDRARDTGCSLKAFPRDAATRIPAFNGMHRFLPALLGYAGLRTAEVEVNHRPRERGRSKYGVWNRLGRGIADLVGVRWLRKRWLTYRIAEVDGETPPTGQ